MSTTMFPFNSNSQIIESYNTFLLSEASSSKTDSSPFGKSFRKFEKKNNSESFSMIDQEKTIFESNLENNSSCDFSESTSVQFSPDLNNKNTSKNKSSYIMYNLKKCEKLPRINTIHYLFHEKLADIQESLNVNGLKATASLYEINSETLYHWIKSHKISSSRRVDNNNKKRFCVKKCNENEITEDHKLFHDNLYFIQKLLIDYSFSTIHKKFIEKTGSLISFHDMNSLLIDHQDL